MYLLEQWLTVIGIFVAGMLAMLGIMIGLDMHRKARMPRTPLTLGFDPLNPINRRSVLNEQYEQPEDGWYEMKPINWR